MALHHRISIACIVGLVNFLAHLHNICLAEAEWLNFNETLSRQLSVDVQHMLKSRKGYASLQKTDNNELISCELLNNDVDMQSNLQQNHCHKPFAQPRSSTTRKKCAVFR